MGEKKESKDGRGEDKEDGRRVGVENYHSMSRS
jgi:hypothetical protein